MFPSYRNQSVDLLCKSTDWFLYYGNIGPKGLIFSGTRHRCQLHGIYGGYYVFRPLVFFASSGTLSRGYFTKFLKIVNWYSNSKNPCSKYSPLKTCKNIDRIGRQTLVRQRPMKSFSSVCLSVCPSIHTSVSRLDHYFFLILYMIIADHDIQ